MEYINYNDLKKQLPPDWVCDHKIICKERMETYNPLPVVPPIGWSPGEELSNAGLECLTHTSAIFSLDKESVTFIRFALPKDKEVALEAELLYIDKSSLELQSHVNCVGECPLWVHASSNLSDERENVRNFLMPRTKRIMVCPFLLDSTQHGILYGMLCAIVLIQLKSAMVG